MVWKEARCRRIEDAYHQFGHTNLTRNILGFLKGRVISTSHSPYTWIEEFECEERERERVILFIIFIIIIWID